MRTRLLPVCLLALAGASTAAPPNVVMIISDDQAWTDYGFMGHDDIRTPHLDALAARSAVFKRGYVPVGLCRPSLMTLATGMYPHQHHVTGNDPSPALADRNSKAYHDLRERLIANIDRFDTVPELLGEAGYLSHQSGKWWEGGFARGGFTHGMTRGFPQRGGRHGDDGLKIGRDSMAPVTDFIDQAVADKKPFFLWYAPFLPHTPHNPPERLLKKHQAADRPPSIAKYHAMCEWFDETCGELLGHLDKRGLREDTLVIYVTDNGWIQNPKGGGYAPRSKQTPYEGGVRTPILLSWPGTIPPGEHDAVVSSVDLAPTLLRAAGARVPDELPGLDLMPVARDGKTLDREAIFGESFAHDVADLDDLEASLLYRWCIEGRWKLLLTYDGKVNRYKSTHPRTERRPQLFDLLADPHETRNLAGDNPDVVARLAQRLDDWWTVETREAQTTF